MRSPNAQPNSSTPVEGAGAPLSAESLRGSPLPTVSTPALVQNSLELAPGKRMSLGTISEAIDLERGRIEADYCQSNGLPLGESFTVHGARGATRASLEIVKLLSGSIVHNITFELPGTPKARGPAQGEPNLRTATLFFPSQAVLDPLAALQYRLQAPESGHARESYDLRQLCDPSGAPLATNLLNVMESSAARWRDIFPKGQRPERLQVGVQALDGGADQLTFSITTKERLGLRSKEISFIVAENRLFTEAEHKALQSVYSDLPSGISKEYFQWFREQQFLAWLWRKYVEPGGSSHLSAQGTEALERLGLESVFHTANGLASQDERSFIFASRMTQQVLRNLAALGTEAIDQMSAVGEKMLVCGVALDRGEFTAENLAHGVPCLGSDPARLGRGLVLTAANLHHEGWMETMRWMNSQGAAELAMPQRKEQQPYDPAVISDYWIRDCGNIYALSFLLGSMTEASRAVLKENASTKTLARLQRDSSGIA